LADGRKMSLQLPELLSTVGSKISHVEHQHDRLLAKIGCQLDLLASITGQRKGWGWGALFGGPNSP
jgi:hypothetical protein